MAELSSFAQSVEDYLEGLEFCSPGICGTCPECQRYYGMQPRAFYTAVENGDVYDEGSFTWRPCECCRSPLGGDRYAAHGIDKESDTLVHFEICFDCLMYLANGDEPEE